MLLSFQVPRCAFRNDGTLDVLVFGVDYLPH